MKIMRNLKVGDQVKIRTDLNTQDFYYMDDGDHSEKANEKMIERHSGDSATIRKVNLYGYQLRQPFGTIYGHTWTDDMFQDDTENDMINKKIGGKIMKNVLGNISKFLVNDENVALTPTGLSFYGKTYSKSVDGMVKTKGTEFIKNIPVGVLIPTTIKDIQSNDTVKSMDGELLRVRRIEKNEVIAISYSSEQVKTIAPTIDILGNKTFKKLITPFEYDGGINPIVNLFMTLFNSFRTGNVEELINDNFHLITSKLSEVNFEEVVKSKTFKTILPIGLIAFELTGFDFDEEFNIWNYKAELKTKVSNLSKRQITIGLLGLAFVLYLNQDRIKSLATKVVVKTKLKNFKENLMKTLNKSKEKITKVIKSVKKE